MEYLLKGALISGGLIVAIGALFLLWYGARLLQPLFRNPKAWRVLEFLIGLIMSWIALELLRFAADSIPL